MAETEQKRIAILTYCRSLRDGATEAAAQHAARMKWADFYPNGLPHDIRQLASDYAARMRHDQ